MQEATVRNFTVRFITCILISASSPYNYFFFVQRFVLFINQQLSTA